MADPQSQRRWQSPLVYTEVVALSFLREFFGEEGNSPWHLPPDGQEPSDPSRHIDIRAERTQNLPASGWRPKIVLQRGVSALIERFKDAHVRDVTMDASAVGGSLGVRGKVFSKLARIPFTLWGIGEGSSDDAENIAFTAGAAFDAYRQEIRATRGIHDVLVDSISTERDMIAPDSKRRIAAVGVGMIIETQYRWLKWEEGPQGKLCFQIIPFEPSGDGNC